MSELWENVIAIKKRRGAERNLKKVRVKCAKCIYKRTLLMTEFGKFIFQFLRRMSASSGMHMQGKTLDEALKNIN